MKFVQLIDVVRDWLDRFENREDVLACTYRMMWCVDEIPPAALPMIAENGRSTGYIDVDAIVRFAASGAAVDRVSPMAFVSLPPPSRRQRRERSSAAVLAPPLPAPKLPWSTPTLTLIEQRRAPEPAEPAPPRAPAPAPKANGGPAPPLGTKSAERLLRSLLRKPRSAADVERAVAAAAISPRVLAAAADRLGVETANGQWRLPG